MLHQQYAALSGRSRMGLWLALGLVFAFFFFFYTCVLPMLAYSGDDWVYLSQFRDMFPSPTRWNPARVFPEILQPFMGHAAALWYALSGDYVQGLIGAHALFMSVGLTALAAGLFCCLWSVGRDAGVAFWGTLFFGVMAFCLFKSKPDGNIFLFYGYDITIEVFYILPAIANSLLVLFLLRGQYTDKCALKDSPMLAGVLFLGIFLAQFSMTFASAIASGYALLTLLRRAWLWWKDSPRRCWRAYRQSWTFFDVVLFTIVVFWIVASFMDATGGRFGRINRGGWDFATAWHACRGLLGQLNVVFMVVAGAVALGTLARMGWKARAGRWQRRDGKFAEILVTSLLCACGLAAMCLLISARVDVHTGSIHAMYGVFFFVLLALLLGAVYLLLEMPRLRFMAPAVALLLLVETCNTERPWARGAAAVEFRPVVTQWLHDVRAAEARGETAVVITVPKLEWPHPEAFFGKALGMTLFAHGVTARRMEITLRAAGSKE